MFEINVLTKVLVAVDAFDNVLAPRLIECAKALAHAVDALALNYAPTFATELELRARTLYLVSQSRLVSKRVSSPSLASLLCALSAGYDAIVVDSATYWHDIIARAAAVLNKPVVSNVCSVLTVSRGEFVRSVCAGRVMQHVRCVCNRPWLLSINTSSFKAFKSNLPPAGLRVIQHAMAQCCVPLKRGCSKNVGLPTLCNAEVVIAGGRAFGSAETFNKYLRPLAAKLNAAVGASRAAVEAGLAPLECQIGQTGKSVAPKLYIAFGISGSHHHMIGVRDSKLILAVNISANSPITKLADYTVVADLHEIIPRLLAFLPLSFR
ncbi:MAG: Electron transfer flavoprotein large subunit [Candidatus Hodgkinia cicadicola]|nr:MAG: Electron transfer flavoprotein large subunit [Candidatus Hodgkinia cicadicola]